jgi:hypothetical protein
MPAVTEFPARDGRCKPLLSLNYLESAWSLAPNRTLRGRVLV